MSMCMHMPQACMGIKPYRRVTSHAESVTAFDVRRVYMYSMCASTEVEPPQVTGTYGLSVWSGYEQTRISNILLAT